MEKEPLACNIDRDIADILRELVSDLGPPKKAIIEVSVLAFAALPRALQLRLKATNSQDRKAILDQLRSLSVEEPINRQRKKP